jgi:hypothetical protein
MHAIVPARRTCTRTRRGASANETIPHAFGEKAVMKLMFAAPMSARQGWRNLVVTPFEVKQIQALRDRLRQEFVRRHALPLPHRIPPATSQHC